KNKIMVVKIVPTLYPKGPKIVRVIGTVIAKDIIGTKKVRIGFEEYKVREISKNEITGRYDLWLDPVRSGNHQIPIVDFTDNEDL
ncbi:hypothetical protein ACTPEF_26530, partial [Clostridioides difficile]